MLNETQKQTLEKLGFKRYEGGGYWNIRGELYAIETKMFVQGAHATDIAQIIYSDAEEIQGFFYGSSLMEELLFYYDEKSGIEKYVKDIAKCLDRDIRLDSVCGECLIILPDDLQSLDIAEYSLSNLLKVVGLLDYFLQKKQRYFERKRINENKNV